MVIQYVFGALFIALGLVLFTFIPRAQRDAKLYKERQLEAYNAQLQKRATDYRSTGLFLPPWRRIKLMAPGFIGAVLFLIGLVWITTGFTF